MGPYIKSRGTGGTKMSANAEIITVETYMYNKGKHLNTRLSYMGLRRRWEITKIPEYHNSKIFKTSQKDIIYYIQIPH